MRLKFTCEPGEKFGRLTVLEVIAARPEALVRAGCACGTTKIIRRRSVVSGHTGSCGCAQRAAATKLGKARAKPGLAAVNWLIRVYKRAARVKFHAFSLTHAEFEKLVKQPCHYCGAAPSRSTPGSVSAYGELVYNGLDRRDNTGGYTTENVVPCCTVCNFRKGADSEANFLGWARLVASRCTA